MVTSKANLRKWGNSLGVRIPKRLAQRLNLHEGSTIELEETDRGILLRTPQVPTLEALIESMDDSQRPQMEDFGPPCGNEVW
ncbi:MAG: AbrB/MazE/SpoVT family DNA-binding domain-containing protein [Phycisphaeraceae bacterium]